MVLILSLYFLLTTDRDRSVPPLELERKVVSSAVRRQREVIILFVTTEEEEMGEGPIISLSPGYCDHCDHSIDL